MFHIGALLPNETSLIITGGNMEGTHTCGDVEMWMIAIIILARPVAALFLLYQFPLAL
jgi:hypothetical protein